jgi:hypothetical protein
MGTTSVNTDPNIGIYLITFKKCYVAGEYIEGEIYLNVNQSSPYNLLTLNLYGKEHVYWTQTIQTTSSGHQGHHHRHTHHRRVHFEDEYINYNTIFNVFTFNDTMVNRGQYCFPFSFLLPAAMTGTIIHTANCYIKYMLKAQLVNPVNP